MTATSFACALLCSALLTVGSALQWSSGSLEDDAHVYLCNNDDLTLAWTVANATGESIVNIQWYYHGRSQELIAMYSGGYFNDMPSYSGRVEMMSNAGLVIRHVTTSESGNYSVEINGLDASGSFTVLRRTAQVTVSKGLMTEDGGLHAGQSRLAVYNNATQQFQAQLTCGSFFYQDQPPFNVIWTTPAGQVVNSSFYQDGQFVLLLDNPVTGGSYTCHIPENEAGAACLHDNQVAGNNIVVVDEVKVRFSILEAQQASLVAENSRLQSQLSAVVANNNRLEEQLERQGRDHEQKLAKIQDELDLRISFHATGLREASLSADEAYVFPTVVNNEGNAYNPTTGSFVAPHNGTYLFMASTSGRDSSDATDMVLMVDQQQVDRARMIYSNDIQSGSAHAVVQLTSGQRVWLKTVGDTLAWGASSAFSGVLISAAAP